MTNYSAGIFNAELLKFMQEAGDQARTLKDAFDLWTLPATQNMQFGAARLLRIWNDLDALATAIQERKDLVLSFDAFVDEKKQEHEREQLRLLHLNETLLKRDMGITTHLNALSVATAAINEKESSFKNELASKKRRH